MTIEQGPPQTPTTSNQPQTISVDLEKYVEMLAELGISLSDKLAILQSLEVILISFIDLGIGIDFTSQSCGQASEARSDAGLDVVHSLQSVISVEQPNKAAEGSAE